MDHRDLWLDMIVEVYREVGSMLLNQIIEINGEDGGIFFYYWIIEIYDEDGG